MFAFSSNPERSGTLPAHFYYDPQIYSREKEAIWYRTWQYLASAEDLVRPGSFVTGMVLDQPVIVVRTKEGALKAYYNTCMHRGHLLAEGKGKRNLLTCPFHAWTYDLNGQLIRAPNSENVADFSCGEFKLVEIRVEAFGLWVFVNLDPDAKPLAEMAPGMIDDMRQRIPGFDKLVYVQTDSFELKANWKFILDQMECYHCPVVHPQIMGGANGYVSQSFDATEYEFHSVHVSKGNYDLIENHKDKLPYDFGDADLLDIVIWYMWPNLVFVAHQGPANIKMLQAVPEGPELTYRHMHMFCKTNPPSENDLGQIRAYRDVAWPQDRACMEKQAIGVKALGYTQGRLMVDKERSWQSEHGTHHFDSLVWQALHGEKAA